MTILKREKIGFPISDNVTLLQYITKENSRLSYAEATLLRFETGGTYAMTLNGKEACIVALTGKYTISDGEVTFHKVGTRQSVFEKIPTDSVYIPNGKTLQIEAETAGKVMICLAPTTDSRKTIYIPAKDNSIEHRGQFNNRRDVQNILDDKSPISEKLLVVEVYTPQANWSSYPPHKHDQNNGEKETFLEEIYYHEIHKADGFVWQRVYTDNLLLDETMTVYNEEIVMVPKGYHPVSVPDGYESYYLNIMSGPIKKWKFNNALEYEWIIHRT